MRLFQDEPKWTPLNRGPELDINPHRRTYLETRKSLAAH
jgi:1,2-dihydroxy-3-keto-5-methylthiopentene dioxygenase